MTDERSSVESRELVTQLLRRAGAGERLAADDLLELVYDELRGMAAGYFARAGGGQTLQPTALVHDVFLRLVDRARAWDDRQHFYAVAATAMRRMLADRARGRRRQKRGGDLARVSLAAAADTPLLPAEEVDLVALDAALTALAALSERQARIVELRFLTGLPVQEVATLLGISVSTVGAEWRMARAFLRRELEREG